MGSKKSVDTMIKELITKDKIDCIKSDTNEIEFKDQGLMEIYRRVKEGIYYTTNRKFRMSVHMSYRPNMDDNIKGYFEIKPKILENIITSKRNILEIKGKLSTEFIVSLKACYDKFKEYYDEKLLIEFYNTFDIDANNHYVCKAQDMECCFKECNYIREFVLQKFKGRYYDNLKNFISLILCESKNKYYLIPRLINPLNDDTGTTMTLTHFNLIVMVNNDPRELIPTPIIEEPFHRTVNTRYTPLEFLIKFEIMDISKKIRDKSEMEEPMGNADYLLTKIEGYKKYIDFKEYCEAFKVSRETVLAFKRKGNTSLQEWINFKRPRIEIPKDRRL